MESSRFKIEFAKDPEDMGALRTVREAVFVVEQAVPPELEWDEFDASSVHVLARDHDGRAIGTARLTPDDHIGRMAVLSEWRGRGVGSALLGALLEQARLEGRATVALHAQTHALGFYARFGFIAHGDEFDDAGIPHRHMHLELGDPEPRRLYTIDSPVQLGAMLRRLAARARRQLALYSPDLDPALLDRADTLAVLRRFATQRRESVLRILAHDLRAATQDGHGLIQLFQRLPSHLSIRVVEIEPDVDYPSAFLIDDQQGYLWRPVAARPQATACLHDPARNRQLLRYFDEVWERARPADELRRL